MTTTVRLTTYNVGQGSGHDKQVKSDLADLRDVSDVLMLQEVSDREGQLPCDGLGLYQPKGDNKEHCALMWRQGKLFEVATKDTKKLSDKTHVGPSGAGGDTLGAVWLHRVALKVPSVKRTLQVMVVHMVPSVVGDAAKGESKDKRQELYRKAVDGIVAKVKGVRDDGAVYIGGDWNAEPSYGQLDPMRPLLNVAHELKNTHGDRGIDYVWREDSQQGCKTVGVKTRKLGSDHKALTVTLELTQ